MWTEFSSSIHWRWRGKLRQNVKNHVSKATWLRLNARLLQRLHADQVCVSSFHPAWKDLAISIRQVARVSTSYNVFLKNGSMTLTYTDDARNHMAGNSSTDQDVDWVTSSWSWVQPRSPIGEDLLDEPTLMVFILNGKASVRHSWRRSAPILQMWMYLKRGPQTPLQAKTFAFFRLFLSSLLGLHSPRYGGPYEKEIERTPASNPHYVTRYGPSPCPFTKPGYLDDAL